MRRSVLSIPLNIAEGCGRGTQKELSRFLDIAIGSTCELETQIYLCYDMELLPKKEQDDLVEETIQIRKMILGFQKSLHINN